MFLSFSSARNNFVYNSEVGMLLVLMIEPVATHTVCHTHERTLEEKFKKILALLEHSHCINQPLLACSTHFDHNEFSKGLITEKNSINQICYKLNSCHDVILADGHHRIKALYHLAKKMMKPLYVPIIISHQSELKCSAFNRFLFINKLEVDGVIQKFLNYFSIASDNISTTKLLYNNAEYDVLPKSVSDPSLPIEYYSYLKLSEFLEDYRFSDTPMLNTFMISDNSHIISKEHDKLASIRFIMPTLSIDIVNNIVLKNKALPAHSTCFKPKPPGNIFKNSFLSRDCDMSDIVQLEKTFSKDLVSVEA